MQTATALDGRTDVRLHPLGELKVKGRKAPVEVYGAVRGES